MSTVVYIVMMAIGAYLLFDKGIVVPCMIMLFVPAMILINNSLQLEEEITMKLLVQILEIPVLLIGMLLMFGLFLVLCFLTIPNKVTGTNDRVFKTVSEIVGNYIAMVIKSK